VWPKDAVDGVDAYSVLDFRPAPLYGWRYEVAGFARPVGKTKPTDLQTYGQLHNSYVKIG